MADDPAQESTLLVPIPEAEPHVRHQRLKFDPAAGMGIPAHITISYPFKPLADLTTEDFTTLRRVFAQTPTFDIDLKTVSWFGRRVIFLEPADPQPLVTLTRAVQREFPEFEPYGGAFDEVRPHLTVGDHEDCKALERLEESLVALLPISHHATEVQLWAGPALSSRTIGWRLVESFSLS